LILSKKSVFPGIIDKIGTACQPDFMMAMIGGVGFRLRIHGSQRLIRTIRISPDARSEKRKNAFSVHRTSVQHLKARIMAAKRENESPSPPLTALVVLLARLVPGRPSDTMNPFRLRPVDSVP